ncbi:DNA-3-methyladenine glycosylase I [Sandaracinus amylolyticus]|uniref:DNA-3-methyladenine glycosylase n=1 Tax=Sandaracinus amylolyticus TaxID=927083 RepID=A0A0F6YFW6_9BACT|nr:DNA-3-methyladenine glycosylase I [Sandaracinus amylolyticus]AKF02916.1 DNA-3-methyladenine glycosylase [Sandaracinus amylolyticus]
MDGLIRGTDGRARCAWPGDDALYLDYHDREWGRPIADDRRLFEKIVLEGFQSGLSWRTILHKRARFRAVFHDFDPARVARYGERDVARLLADPGIIRHRGKIEAAIANARAAVALIEHEGSLARVIWSFEPPAHERPSHVDLATVKAMPTTAASERLAKALKARGFRFFGPTTAYAMMQAVGLVNDHFEGCAMRDEVETARAAFVRPR